LKRVLVHHPGKELELANNDPVAHHFEQPVDVKRFRSDHLELLEHLEEVGVEVIRLREVLEDNKKALEQSLECPNLVFVRDSSTVTKKGVFLFRMGLPTRRKETPVIKAAHTALDIPIVLELKEPETFEGGGFAILENNSAVTGLCDRSTQGALDQMGNYLLKNRMIETWVTLEMPKGIVHIDGEFAELPGKRAISHLDVMENIPASFRTRREEWKGNFMDWLRDDGWDIIEITDKECFDMAANFLTVDEDLAFHYTGNLRVMKEVNKRGIEVVQIPGEEMRKGMGGIHCMTCPVLRI
jgi:arginine deiminase